MTAAISERKDPETDTQMFAKCVRGHCERVLSVDGGGVRGIIPARMVEEIEKRTGQAAAELFTVFAGVSSGSMLALALTRPGEPGKSFWSAKQVVQLYEEQGRDIFPTPCCCSPFSNISNLIFPKYFAFGIERVLERALGDCRLKDALRDVVVPAYEETTADAVYFTKADPKWNGLFMRDVARASTAAPTYFFGKRITVDGKICTFLDGGIFESSPVFSGYFAAREHDPKKFVVCSLGTGVVEPRAHSRFFSGGKIAWANRLDEIIASQKRMADSHMKESFSTLDPDRRYFRFETTVAKEHYALDDVTTETVSYLKGRAETMIEEKNDELRDLCNELAKGC